MFLFLFCFYRYGNHRDLHVLTHSFPTRRSSDRDGDAEGLSFKFDPQATLRFDWPSGFGTPHDVHLTGRAAGWREDAGWRIATPALRIDGTRSEEHTSELQSLMRTSYAVFCLKKKTTA